MPDAFDSDSRIVVAENAPQRVLAEIAYYSQRDPVPQVVDMTFVPVQRRPRRSGMAPGRHASRPRTGCHDSLPQRNTLFCGERVGTNSSARRGAAATFRRPTSSTAQPHTRPVFVTGSNGADARVCQDFNAPERFSSFERGRTERIMAQRDQAMCRPGAASALAFSQRNATPDVGNSACPSRACSAQGFAASLTSSQGVATLRCTTR
eukprot:TRINITY_DN40963_c0_g1_i1.p1 TRINITY_DN40963_c0_g1~~TRINITY_DN40963_c0_g1_i1.p1  ORF type:complete len:207 (-),score=21.52 TRINITY_DN40963_c0_g1_i1:121-741(-)